MPDDQRLQVEALCRDNGRLRVELEDIQVATAATEEALRHELSKALAEEEQAKKAFNVQGPAAAQGYWRIHGYSQGLVRALELGGYESSYRCDHCLTSAPMADADA